MSKLPMSTRSASKPKPARVCHDITHAEQARVIADMKAAIRRGCVGQSRSLHASTQVMPITGLPFRTEHGVYSEGSNGLVELNVYFSSFAPLCTCDCLACPSAAAVALIAANEGEHKQDDGAPLFNESFPRGTPVRSRCCSLCDDEDANMAIAVEEAKENSVPMAPRRM